MFRASLIAIQFLTRLPVRLEPPPTGREIGLSLLWYPAVGLLIGALLWMAALLCSALATLVAAALVLSVWVALTGALHLDGLADTADAWVGGRGDRARTLAIMKDPHIGPMALATVVCLLLVKFGGLSALLDLRRAAPWTDGRLICGCVLPPLLSRTSVTVLFAHTAYVRVDGLGADLARHQSRTGALLVGLCVALAVLPFGGRYAVRAALITALVYLFMRRRFVKRLGGITGDCVGAMVEVIEMVVLVTVVVP